MGVNEFTFIQLGPLTSFLDKDPVLVSRMEISLYLKNNIMAGVYVDDILISAETVENINEIKSFLEKNFKMKDLKEVKSFLE